jgi:two-component system NtrC family sensor kinase
MLLLYFVPLLLLTIFFQIQYRRLWRDSLRAHLQVLAEHQANTFDLFLRERLVNLSNIINDPLFPDRALGEESLGPFLLELQRTSDAFVDLGVVDEAGVLEAYVGPINFPGAVNYRNEEWFRDLSSGDRHSVITEIYLGFRGRPHFTIAVRPRREQSGRILRSTLSPERLSNYLTTLEGAAEVHAAVVNRAGVLQVITPRAAEILPDSLLAPPSEPDRGFVPAERSAGHVEYAYAWLSETPWALVVTATGQGTPTGMVRLPSSVFMLGFAFFALMGAVILLRARYLVGRQIAAEQHEAELSGQLVQAAKLASVGELAAGIAHEINNPLAIIAEEAGVLKDSLDPELAEDDDEPLDLAEHLSIIHEAVFRCRDITRKLLTFVRQTAVKLEVHHIHDILNDVLDDMLGNELSISNIEVVRRYDDRVDPILTDCNQMVQVFVNLIKNAMDAMPQGGVLTVATAHRNSGITISISDTGCGMSPEQLEKVFLPFFTTKEPGKGTGLGLSVSCTIIGNLGGKCYVASELSTGSTFTVELPYEMK